jgi:outer membrane biosynthesis protein TonB
MENNNVTPEPPKQTQVMDIQPPQQSVQQPPVEQPKAQNDPEVAAEASQDEGKAPVLVAQQPKEKSHRTPILAIACAVIIAGVFASVAFLMYFSKPAAEQPKTASTTEQQTSVTPTEVEDTSKSIDESTASLDDAADYNDAAINDTTLGL